MIEDEPVIKICLLCHRPHTGDYGTGRYCSQECSSKARKKNRRSTINKKKRAGTYNNRYSPGTSNLLKNVSRILSKAGIKHTVQHRVGKYYFDIKIGNVLLEVNGNFWHACPKQYKPNDIVPLPGKKKRAIDIWKKDNRKQLLARKHGFRVIYLWLDDIHKMNDMMLVETVMKSIKTGRPIQRLKG